MAEFDITCVNPGTNRTSEFRIAYMNVGQAPLIAQDKLINYVILGEDRTSTGQLDTFSVQNIESISLRRKGNLHYCKFCPYTSSRKRYMRFHRDSLHKDRVRKSVLLLSDDDQTADSLVNYSTNGDNSESESCTRVSDVSKSSSSESPEKELCKVGEKSSLSCSSSVISELYFSENEPGEERVDASANLYKSISSDSEIISSCSDILETRVSKQSFSGDSELNSASHSSVDNSPPHETREPVTRLQDHSPHNTHTDKPKLCSTFQSQSEPPSNNNDVFEAHQKQVESNRRKKKSTKQNFKRSYNDSFVRIISRRRKCLRRVETCRLACCVVRTQQR